MTAKTQAFHLILNGAPICRPKSAGFWGLYGVRTAAEFAACENKCARCEASKRWAFIQRQAAQR